jgi:hypothetical protein
MVRERVPGVSMVGAATFPGGTCAPPICCKDSRWHLQRWLTTRVPRYERRRGISVPSVAFPLLVVAGRTYAETRGRPVADFYGADLIEFPNLHHVALVQERAVRTAIGAWLHELTTRPQM